MDTILNIPEPPKFTSVAQLPGDLRQPPTAKYANPPTPSFQAVTKPLPAPPARPCRALKLLLASTLVLLLAVVGVFLLVDPPGMPPAWDRLAVNEDPLNDLLKVFTEQGVEPSDNACMACFFSDPGRIRKASGSTEAFIVYRSDNAINFVEVITHVFNPPNDFPVALTPFALPFSFWMSADENADGQPDAWEPISPEYRKVGSVMGWEKGAFFGTLPSMPFFKISFNDVAGTWRPQVGNVLLVPPEEEQAAPQLVGAEMEPAVQEEPADEGAEFEAPEAPADAELEGSLSTLVGQDEEPATEWPGPVVSAEDPMLVNQVSS